MENKPMTRRGYHALRNLPRKLRYDFRLFLTEPAIVLGRYEWGLKSCKRLEELGAAMNFKNPTTSEIERFREIVYQNRPDLRPSSSED